MGESQVEDLVTVLLQCLNLHAGDAVEQTPELSVPRHRRWVPWYRARDAIVSVEQLPPKELISGDSQPLPAGQASSQHSINWDILHPNILWIQMGFGGGG
uniref:Uncharacterized protein n=1 Tax=Takifugu rubripes TaxID=31033 RepID=H2VF02_TAKRU